VGLFPPKVNIKSAKSRLTSNFLPLVDMDQSHKWFADRRGFIGARSVLAILLGWY